MEILTIYVHSILNSELATSSEQADVLFDEIKEKLKEADFVKVNFSKVSVMVSNFVSPLVWKIYTEKIDAKSVQFVGLTSSQKSLLSTTKDVTLRKLGKRDNTKFPETKDDVVSLLSHDEPISIRVESLEDVREVYQFVKNFSRKPISIFNELLESSTYFFARDKKNTELLNYGYLSVKPIDHFVLIEPFYVESDNLEKNSYSWNELNSRLEQNKET